MEIIILPTPEEASAVAALLVARQIREKPAPVLGLATGSTPCVNWGSVNWGSVFIFVHL